MKTVHESGAQAESVIGQATPGPWQVSGQIGFVTRKTLARKYAIARAGEHNDFAWATSIEDARLITAAPDLLAACKDCAENRGDWAAKMFAAIRKAEGRTP